MTDLPPSGDPEPGAPAEDDDDRTAAAAPGGGRDGREIDMAVIEAGSRTLRAGVSPPSAADDVPRRPADPALDRELREAGGPGLSVLEGRPEEVVPRVAAELGLAPEECVAIEDSNTGAKSAVAAGCTVLCVPHHVPILEGEGRVFTDTLAGLDAAGLARLTQRD